MFGACWLQVESPSCSKSSVAHPLSCLTGSCHYRLLRVNDVLFEQVCRLARIAASTRIQDLVVILLRLLLAGRYRHLGADKATHMAVVRFYHGEELGAVAGRVKQLMKAPVHLAPFLRTRLPVV